MLHVNFLFSFSIYEGILSGNSFFFSDCDFLKSLRKVIGKISLETEQEIQNGMDSNSGMFPWETTSVLIEKYSHIHLVHFNWILFLNVDIKFVD